MLNNVWYLTININIYIRWWLMRYHINITTLITMEIKRKPSKQKMCQNTFLQNNFGMVSLICFYVKTNCSLHIVIPSLVNLRKWKSGVCGKSWFETDLLLIVTSYSSSDKTTAHWKITQMRAKTLCVRI